MLSTMKMITDYFHFYMCIEWLLYLCRADKCQEARKQTQGIVLFGNKIKVTPLDTNGRCTVMAGLLTH